MKPNSQTILMSVLCLIATSIIYGQAYQPQNSTQNTDLLRQGPAVPVDRRAYDFYAPNRMGGNSQLLRGYSTNRYPGSMLNRQPMGTRYLQPNYSHLDPLTSWRGVATEPTRMWLPQNRTAATGAQSFMKQRSSLLDPSPAYNYSQSNTLLDNLNRGIYESNQTTLMQRIPRYDHRYWQANRYGTVFPEFAGPAGQQPRGYVRIATGEVILGQVNENLLNSPLFSGVRPLTDQELRDMGDKAELMESQRQDTSNRPLRQPLHSGVSRPLNETGQAETGRLVKPIRPEDGASAGSSWAAAGDVYTHMRTVTNQLIKPLAPPAREEALAGNEKTTSPGMVTPDISSATPGAETLKSGQATAEDLDETAKPYTATEAAADHPLETFVGTEQSRTNQYLAEAEKLLKAGQYYKAANIYELARVIDMDNPLPLMGRSIALLAAGEYVTSVNSLFQAIDQFGALGHFKIDLTAFVVDLNMLDRRRADLERRLEQHEDFRLRFLLGFAEYYSGMEELGLRNLTKASEFVPEKFVNVGQYVKSLKLRHETSSGNTPAK